MLDDYSRRFSAALLARYPHWAAHLGTRDNGDGTQHLVVAIPRPLAADTVGGIALDSAGGEVTVECGQHYHAHFGAQGGGMDAAFDFVDAILAERVAFMRVERGDIVLGGTMLEADEARALIAGGAWPAWRGPMQPDRLWLWSWQGSFDAGLTRAV